MRKRRGISTIVGAAFFIIAMTIAIVYVSYSMDTLDKFVQTVVVKSSVSRDTVNEEFVVSKVTLDNNKFNITVFNPGNIPVKLTRLWVVNKTDTDWVAKYDLNEVISPGEIVRKIGQNIPLSALDTASYSMKLVTERGNSQNLFVNAVGEESLYLKLKANPEKIATGFNSIISLQVINIGTSTLLNLKPEMDSITTPVCSTLCSYQYNSGPDPASYATLGPGDSATFEWIYEINGNGGDTVSFSASLVNGVDEVSTSVTVGNVLLAEQAGVGIEAVGLGKTSLSSDILIFHQETALTPNSKYQMYSGSPDGGTDGTIVQMESTIPNFFTNNGTLQITVPAGLWTASLQLQSEAMPQTLIADDEAMIFHFEDGSLQDPDNSERTTNERDLVVKDDQTIKIEETDSGSTSGGGNTVSTDTSMTGVSNHLYLAAISTKPDIQITGVSGLGLTWTVVDEICGGSGQTRTEVWTALGSASTGTVTADIASGSSAAAISVTRFSGIDTASPIGATTVKNTNGIGGACSGGSDSASYSTAITTTNTDAMVYGAVGLRQRAHTPGATYAEIDEVGSGAGAGSAGVATEQKILATPGATVVDGTLSGSADWTSVAIEIVPGPGLCDYPTFQAGTGPHSSASYYFDGIDDCFVSRNPVSSGDENHIGSNDVSTSLWFKTDGIVTSEQYLVFWGGDGTCPSCDYYKISLNSVGKVLYEYNMNSGGSSTTTCLSTNEYDDDKWYHVIGTRDASDDDCRLYITNLDGSNAESTIVHNPSYSESTVTADDHWHVGSNKAENGNYFKGWIDDIVHWNSYELTSTETDDISKVNYGTGAHQFGIDLDLTDKDGNFVSNVYSTAGASIAFQDSKALGDNNDAGYGIYNVTFNLPQVVVPISQRLNFSMNFVPSTSTWEALDVDMKIDDITMTPYSSYLQIPIPDKSFPSYFIHDNDNEIDTFVSFSGTSGIYMTVKGTRIAFIGTAGEGSFAAMIKSVNGTSATYDVLSTKDSIYIPHGSKAQLFFYMPTDHPSVQPPTEGTVIIPGNYDASIWLHGYTDLGETFSKTIKLGNVLVVD